MELAIRIALLLGTAGLIVAGIYLGYLDQVGAQTACFTLAFGILIFVFLSQFKRFKGPFGVEGEMWEKEMEEAQAIKNDFRDLATVIAKPLIKSSMRLGRFDAGLSRREAREMTENMRNILQRAGATTDLIDTAIEDYRIYTTFDIAAQGRKIAQEFMNKKVSQANLPVKEFPQPITPELRDKWDGVVSHFQAVDSSAKQIVKAFGFENVGNVPSLVRNHISDCPYLDDSEKRNLLGQIEEFLDDADVFWRTGEIRRPEIWYKDDDEEK